ncbi:hypothetical protein [Tenacibaculum singaporense]|uniref:hypothetical protein n=1 Tax=Tenacibaculum singaporense TaxID=2358479 RepID=UPI000F691304|nr:hypothetical protein [Tenacibaculum singaporense]RSC92587.1 hypothetical protein EI424_14175 [Tenacibaculum singaporense]
MTKTEEYKSSVISLVNLSRSYNEKIGIYQEHFINENFTFSVRLDNNTAIKISRTLAQDYEKLPSILTEEDLIEIAGSLWEI